MPKKKRVAKKSPKRQVAKVKSRSSRKATRHKKPVGLRRAVGQPKPTRASAKIHQGVGSGPADQPEDGTLSQAAGKIGAALGKADRVAHQAGALLKEEGAAISGKMEAIKKQLQKTTRRLRRALS